MKFRILTVISVIFITGGVAFFYRGEILALFSRISADVVPAPGRLPEVFTEGGLVIASTTADFNSDEINDIAVIVEDTAHPLEDRENLSSEVYPRKFIILLGKEGGYYLSASSTKAILLNDEGGGGLGDPLESLEFENDNLIVRYFGGAGWRWADEYHFRFEQDRWRLVFYSNENLFAPDPDTENQCTYEYDFIKRTKNTSCHNPGTGKSENRGLRTFNLTGPIWLEDFNIHDFWLEYLGINE